MEKQNNNYYGNTQIVYGGCGTQIINDNSLVLRDELLKEIKKTKSLIEQKEIFSEDKFEDFKNHIIYDLQSQNNIKDWICDNPQLQIIIDKLNDINESNKKNHRITIGSFLSNLSNVITILSVTQLDPQIIVFFKNIVDRIIDFLN